MDDPWIYDAKTETWTCPGCGREVYDPGHEFGCPELCACADTRWWRECEEERPE